MARLEAAKFGFSAGFARLCACTLILLVVALLSPHAFAQESAVYYQNAAAAAEQGRAALRHGSVILMVPAGTLFCGIFVLFYWRRNKTR